MQEPNSERDNECNVAGIWCSLASVGEGVEGELFSPQMKSLTEYLIRYLTKRHLNFGKVMYLRTNNLKV